MSGSYGTHCEHVYAETITGRVVEAWVHVRAMPDTGPAMTRGRAYRCVRCRRSINLTARAGKGMPEPPSSRVYPKLSWDMRGSDE